MNFFLFIRQQFTKQNIFTGASEKAEKFAVNLTLPLTTSEPRTKSVKDASKKKENMFYSLFGFCGRLGDLASDPLHHFGAIFFSSEVKPLKNIVTLRNRLVIHSTHSVRAIFIKFIFQAEPVALPTSMYLKTYLCIG